jgi:pimeloyl-ACP methyl ester carboxylesterase
MLITRMALVVMLATVLVGARAPVSPRRDLDVSVRQGDVTLAGTLSVPQGRAQRWPVAVFVSGDGPQDRDGNPGTGGLFRVLADSLVAHGVAVFRHDDRGAGRSTTPTGPPSYRALLGDTRAAISMVRGRREVDARCVVLVGHSEGAKTCEVLAAEDARLAGIALLAGATAVNVDTLLEEQARLEPEGPAPRLLSTLRRAEAGEHAQNANDLTDWMREHLEIAPRTLLPRIHCPVLILQGEGDRLVRTHHAAEAAALIRGGGNRRVELRTFPGLSHAFNHWAPGMEPSPEATRPDPVVANTLTQWIVTVVSTRAIASPRPD